MPRQPLSMLKTIGISQRRSAPVPFVFDGLFKEHAVLVSDGVHAEPAADAEPCTMSFDPEGSYYRPWPCVERTKPRSRG